MNEFQQTLNSILLDYDNRLQQLKKGETYKLAASRLMECKFAELRATIEIKSAEFDNAFMVAAQFCPKCSPETWGNYMFQHNPAVSKCMSCGHVHIRAIAKIENQE